MELLSVKDLCKNYEKFSLKKVSFCLDEGYIMGFIGRNGAGKTTTLKSMLNLVGRDGGEVQMFGKDFLKNEFYCKQNIGFMLGGIDYYPKLKADNIAKVVKRFYDSWDDAVFARYLEKFELDVTKRGEQLSAGMKVKFSLALALSHNARLLILDEPTSGLDPVSRDELIELFQEIIEGGDRSILFSTHITSDLDKCADYITYIKDGAIIASEEKDSFLNSYKLVRGAKAQLTPALTAKLIGIKENAFGFNALIKANDMKGTSGLETAPADLESVMIHMEKE